MSMTPAVTISAPVTTVLSDATRVSFTLDTPDGPFELFYHIRGSAVTADMTAAVAAALLPAMRQGWAIQTEEPISARVRAAIPDIEDIIHAWDSSYKKVSLILPDTSYINSTRNDRGTGVFFSGGMDSFYTFLKNKDRVDALIFVLGFDVALDNHHLKQKVTTAIRQAAEQFNLPLIEVETNLRDFSDRYVSWDLAHGAALASVALLLGAEMHKIYIPASDSYADLMPCGSHPLLDPLWSTEALQIIHDGCEAKRVQKAAIVAQNDVALQTLRVCWKNPDSAYNCGRCEKCLRTMVNLYAVGALNRCPTFEVALDPRRIARMRVGDDILAYWKENLAAVKQRGSSPALEAAIRAATRKAGPVRRLFRSVRAKYSNATLLTAMARWRIYHR
ncbi:MAG: hypothetical protein ACLFVO_16585 [Chloroflexaceae bacterium]